jgi:hypothetical protein
VDSPRPDTDSAPVESPIIGLRPAVTGVFASLRCPACATVYERYQPTVAGLAFGYHVCPACQHPVEVLPDVFDALLDRMLPPVDEQLMLAISREATLIAQRWYRVPSVARLLTYRGINLGEPTERELLAFIVSGLHAGLHSQER